MVTLIRNQKLIPILFLILLLYVLNNIAQSKPINQIDKFKRDGSYIRIALSVDDRSIKDFLIIMNSVISTAINPTRLIFHIVVCGKDLEVANILHLQVSSMIKSCYFNEVKYRLIPFTLPKDSGFANQLKAGYC